MKSTKLRKIGITTGGGDCPGLNAVIYAATRCAIERYDCQVLGILDGFEGLVRTGPDAVRPLSLSDVHGILPRGGTILGTTNCGNPFVYRVVENGQESVRDLSEQVVANARALGLDALLVVGGDGTQKIGLHLYQKGLPIVGIPKTIDNDLSGTDYTFGFESAVHIAAEAVERLHTTAESHHRIILLEVMGRDAGWIALHAGLTGGAHLILIPEIPLSLDKICAVIERRYSENKKYSIIVVAEGVRLAPELVEVVPPGVKRPKRFVSDRLAELIAERTQHDVRVTVLGHTQRGGSPTPADRLLSARFGVAAVEMAARGEFGQMAALRGGAIVQVPLTEACAKMKTVDPQGELVHVARSIGISFGDA